MKKQNWTGLTILLSVAGLIYDYAAEQIRDDKTAPAKATSEPQEGEAVLQPESNHNAKNEIVIREQNLQSPVDSSTAIHTGADNLSIRHAGQAEARKAPSEIGFVSSPEKKIAEKLELRLETQITATPEHWYGPAIEDQ